MKKVKAVIFDCDGVMFSSRVANDAYYNDILSHFGKPPMTVEQSNFAHMHTADDSVANLFKDDPLLPEVLAYRRQINYLRYIPMMQMEPYLQRLLESLRPRYRTAISTNRSDTMASVLYTHGLEGYFDLVVSSLDVKRPKPDPESLITILTHFGLSPNEAIYIGDSVIDESAAKMAGVPLVAYQNPELAAAHYVNNFLEVERLLLGA